MKELLRESHRQSKDSIHICLSYKSLNFGKIRRLELFSRETSSRRDFLKRRVTREREREIRLETTIEKPIFSTSLVTSPRFCSQSLICKCFNEILLTLNYSVTTCRVSHNGAIAIYSRLSCEASAAETTLDSGGRTCVTGRNCNFTERKGRERHTTNRA